KKEYSPSTSPVSNPLPSGKARSQLERWIRAFAEMNGDPPHLGHLFNGPAATFAAHAGVLDAAKGHSGFVVDRRTVQQLHELRRTLLQLISRAMENSPALGRWRRRPRCFRSIRRVNRRAHVLRLGHEDAREGTLIRWMED